MSHPEPPRTVPYGPLPCQAAQLFLPVAPNPPVICLLHGGFWRCPWGREQMAPMARDLQGRGFAVWNLGYRRVGEPGGGWPGTFEDVAAGIDALAELAGDGVALDLRQLVVVGHSAGGQLALWSASRGDTARVRPVAVLGLAPVSDLERCHAYLGDPGPVAALMGGAPHEQAQRYQQASPLGLLPLGLRQVIIHGAEDAAVPPHWSRDYVARARAAGDDASLSIVDGADHMALLDPAGPAHGVLCDWLLALTTR